MPLWRVGGRKLKIFFKRGGVVMLFYKHCLSLCDLWFRSKTSLKLEITYDTVANHPSYLKIIPKWTDCKTSNIYSEGCMVEGIFLKYYFWQIDYECVCFLYILIIKITFWDNISHCSHRNQYHDTAETLLMCCIIWLSPQCLWVSLTHFKKCIYLSLLTLGLFNIVLQTKNTFRKIVVWEFFLHFISECSKCVF